jgi:ABC-2 type transport system ATP-binding protein
MAGRATDGVEAVVVQELERRFGSFVAVSRLSLRVTRGEIFGFIGPNGAGKSTAIRMFCGLLAPSGGSGRVAGFDLCTEPEKIKAHIGYMSQKFSLYEELTIEENLDFFGGIYGLDPRRKRLRKEWVLEMVGLRHLRTSRTGALPTGWRQRLALGCATLHEPSIVFLDEPTSGVDPLTRRRFWDLIYALSDQGVTIFVTTHAMDEAEYCSRIGLMHRGELIATGSPEFLRRDVMQDDVLEIRCDRPEEALAVVEETVGVKGGSLFGKGVRILAEPGGSVVTALRSGLAQKGLRVERVEKVVPSLDDVFVSLIGARDRALSPLGEVRH